MISARFVSRIDAGDRALLRRLSLSTDCAQAHKAVWQTLTAFGSARVTISAALLSAALYDARGLYTLGISHLLVQCFKRSIGRPRPNGFVAHVAVPDRFSFPSGHSAAALSIALHLSQHSPGLGIILLVLGALSGLSRVALGVHYPGDVLAGQLLALVTWFALGS